VVSVRIPLADRVYDAVDGGLRCRVQLSHLDSPSVTGAPSEPLVWRRTLQPTRMKSGYTLPSNLNDGLSRYDRTEAWISSVAAESVRRNRA
jgi:hypothetical protein